MCRSTWARVVLAAIALLASSSTSAPAGAEMPPPSETDLLIVLDASGSMWGQIEGENKIVIARRVLSDFVGKVPDGANVGLVAYGHRREADCKDIEIVVPPAPIDRPALKRKIDAINPKGKTPITGALNAVFDDLARRNRPATIILISDGLENCRGDPCQAVRDAKAKGVRFVLHVIGFDVGDVDVSQLKCVAQAGGGLYFGADDAGQFTAALAEAAGER